MTLPPWAALLAALPSSIALAADAADPGAAAPRPAYRSVFEGRAAGVEDGTVDWRKANADVARFPRGHADLLKWENGRERAVPSTAPAPAPQPQEQRK
jgi:hypothetical protein